MPSFRMHLRAHGMVAMVFKTLDDSQHHQVCIHCACYYSLAVAVYFLYILCTTYSQSSIVSRVYPKTEKTHLLKTYFIIAFFSLKQIGRKTVYFIQINDLKKLNNPLFLFKDVSKC